LRFAAKTHTAADTIRIVAPLLDVQKLTIEFPSIGRALPSTRAARSGQALPAPQPQAATCVAAVRELSFFIDPGEVLGLVGESGSGKSVTALAIMGLLPPAANVSGDITFQNGEAYPTNLTTLPAEQLRQLRGSRIAMIFQEPMTALNPVMRVGDQIAEAVVAHGMPKYVVDELRRSQGEKAYLATFARPPFLLRTLARLGGFDIEFHTSKQKAWQLAVQALRDVAIPDPEQRVRSYPHQLSGGMRQRVMIAMAIVNRPLLLIADEPTTSLDVTIQQQILDLLNDLRNRFSLAMLFISHDLAVVSHVADRVAVLYAGSLVELAPRASIFSKPAHPYTQGLLRAIPTLATDRAQPLATIDGTVPPIATLPPGCPFEPRCPCRIPACGLELPPLVEIAPGHLARCPVVNS
jgi:oligopeptide/dipeptide ABC transporter ATP-binding protein